MYKCCRICGEWIYYVNFLQRGISKYFHSCILKLYLHAKLDVKIIRIKIQVLLAALQLVLKINLIKCGSSQSMGFELCIVMFVHLVLWISNLSPKINICVCLYQDSVYQYQYFQLSLFGSTTARPTFTLFVDDKYQR